MSPKLDFRERFARIAAEKDEVRLINNYRGIPVSYQAIVEEVHDADAGVIFRAHKLQCVCLELDRFTYIESPSLPGIIKGRVKNLDILSMLATVSNFESASPTIGRRTMVRVQPKNPLDVLILFKGEKIRGRLADISSNGVGIFVLSAFTMNPGVLKKNEQVQISTRLPGERGVVNEVRLAGTILYVNPDKGSFRLGINTIPEAHAKNVVTQFVALRKAEINLELLALYEKFYRMRSDNTANVP